MRTRNRRCRRWRSPLRSWRTRRTARPLAQGAPAAITVDQLRRSRTATRCRRTTRANGAKNVSPPLAWSGAPAATKEFALILDDPDANFGGRGPFVHWVIYKIPGTAKGLPEAVPMGATVNAPGLTGAINGLSGSTRSSVRARHRWSLAIAARRRRRRSRITITSPCTR